MINNQTLYNAALNGALAGMFAGSPVQDTTSADYAPYTAVATAFASAVDAGIGADATLTAAGATIVPTTAAQQANALAKSDLMHGICSSYWFQKSAAIPPNTGTPPVPPSPGQYGALPGGNGAAPAVTALYNAAVTAMTNAGSLS